LEFTTSITNLSFKRYLIGLKEEGAKYLPLTSALR